MVQCVCEAFPDFDIVFAGNIVGDFPVWLKSYENLKFISASYNELPEIIASFDVAFLPVYGDHQKILPVELYQYLACGKVVVTSDISGLPDCKAIFVSSSVDETIDNIRLALKCADNPDVVLSVKTTTQNNDWEKISRNLLKNDINLQKCNGD